MGKRHAAGGSKVHEFQALTGGKFSFMPDGEVGAADSRHGVFFGRLGIEPVAVKPTTSVKSAEHEATMLETVRGIGISAVRPLCIIPGQQKDAFLVTKRIPKLISVASLPMSGQYQRRIGQTEGVLTTVAQTLATMHGAGMTHGDSQVKNFGLIGPRDRPSVVVYDLEKGGTDRKGHIKSAPLHHDLSSLSQSLAYKGLGGPNLDNAADVLEHVVLDPYYEQAVDLGLDAGLAEEVRQHAYVKFLDKQDDLLFSQANSGHDLSRSSQSPLPH